MGKFLGNLMPSNSYLSFGRESSLKVYNLHFKRRKVFAFSLMLSSEMKKLVENFP